jgi:hypothetical protein
MKWLALESSNLFVRQSYNRMWQYIEESYFDVVLGKKLRQYRKHRDVLVLHDHQPGNEPPLVFDGAFVVAPVSPDLKNYHEYFKHKILDLWMPLTTTSELVAMNSIEPQLEGSELQQRIATYGPIPRQVFAVSQKAFLDKLTGKINSFELGRNFLHMLSNAELPENKHGLSWWIVHVDATKDLQGVSKICWASEDIFNRVITRLSTPSFGDRRLCCHDSTSTTRVCVAPCCRIPKMGCTKDSHRNSSTVLSPQGTS